MIIKLIGMTLVFSSACAIGWSLAECLSARERELANLADGVEMMKGELMYNHAPVRDIIYKVSPLVKGECKTMFSLMCSELKKVHSPVKAWEYALGKAAPSMSFKKSDREYLVSLGFLLSAYDLKEQESHLNELKSKILTLNSEAAEAKNKNARLVRMLGIYGGALLCILMF